MARDPAKLGKLICEAFGLDANDVARISFDWRSGQIGKVTVEMWVTDGQGAKFGEALRKDYELVEVS